MANVPKARAHKKLLYLLSALFAVFALLWIRQNAASAGPSRCELAMQLRSGQSVTRAMRVLGKPDSIYQTDGYRTNGMVTVYEYRQHPLAEGDVCVLVRDSKILGVTGCRDYQQ